MKIFVRLIVLSLLFCTFVGNAYTEPLSLDQALGLGKEQNKELLINREELGTLSAQVSQAGAYPNPEFSVEKEEVTRFEANQTLEGPGKRRLRKSAAQLELEAAQIRYSQLERTVLLQIKSAYYGLTIAQERVYLSQEQVQTLQRALVRIEDRFKSGEVPLADKARAQVEAQVAQNEFLAAQAALKEGVAELNRLLGRKLSVAIEPTTEILFEPKILDVEQLTRLALEHRPDLAAQRSELQAAEAGRRLAYRQTYWPDLRVGLLTPRGENQSGLGGRLGIEVPLWYRFAGERQAAKARIQTVKARRADLEAEIELQVFRAVNQVGLASAQVDLWKKSILQASEALRLSQERYLAGQADLITFLQARKAYRDARASYLQALYDYATDSAALELAIGQPL